MKKKQGKKKIIILIIVIVLILIVGLIFSILNNLKNERNNKIVATKVLITEYGKEQKITYTLEIKDYNIESAVKQIIFGTEQEANLEYERYEMINEYELREIGLELKKEKLILTMPEEQFLMEIGYDKENNISRISQHGGDMSIINQEELIKCLTNQGYEIK